MIGFVLSSVLLGVGLAMDAFSVSIANGLKEPQMRAGRKCLIAGVYAFFQCLMPLIGWFCVHMLVRQFQVFEAFIPWIALILLLWIGGKMLRDGITDAKAAEAPVSSRERLDPGLLLVQGIATSIDALSVGFAIAHYSPVQALACGLMIAAVTFLICMGGLAAGQKLGEKTGSRAGILGGCILIFIGLEIFIRGVFF